MLDTTQRLLAPPEPTPVALGHPRQTLETDCVRSSGGNSRLIDRRRTDFDAYPPAIPAPIKTILLIGAFGPPFIAFTRSCVAHNIQVHLLTHSKSEQARPRISPLLTSVRHVQGDLKTNVQAFLEIVRNQVKALEIDAIVAVSDHYLIWLLENAASFGPHCKVLASSLESLRLMTSKTAQIELAGACGFEVLPTWALTTLEDCDQIPASSFPVCLRPSRAGVVDPWFKVVVAQSATHLIDFLKQLTGWQGTILAQPFKHLPNLLIHGARSESGEILALEPFLVDRKFEGLALTTERTTCPPEILSACAKFAEAAGIHGPFHFDLLYDPEQGRAFYLEANVRLGGTTAKVFQLGFDEPALTLTSFGFQTPERTMEERKGANRSTNVRFLLKYLCYLFFRKLAPLDYPSDGFWKNLSRSIKDLLFAKDAVFDLRDFRTSMAYYAQLPQNPMLNWGWTIGVRSKKT